MSKPIIKLSNINLYYDKDKPTQVWALRNISLEIFKGEYVSFFGPSGCGKTTLLYLISGMEIGNMSGGSVAINGKDITKFSKRELAIFRQIGIGIVFQQFNLIPSITVLDNIALPMAFLGISLKRRQQEAQSLLERLAIGQLANRFPHELSGGQQQRVGIARALANNPPIIIADEPLGNLDSENANRVLAFLKELNEKDGRTIIMVTHESWSLRDAKKVFFMKDGELLKTEEHKEKTSQDAKAISPHFYKELYPNLSSTEIMSKSLSNLFLRGYSLDETKRFEFFLNQRFGNKIDGKILMQVLDRPYKDGGLGLWRPKAAKISKMVDSVIENRENLEKIFKELDKNPEVPVAEEIQRIKDWLFEEYKGKISALQQLRIEEIINERIRNIIAPENLLKVLSLPQSQFGVGLSYRTSQKIAEKLESILGADGTKQIANSL